VARDLKGSGAGQGAQRQMCASARDKKRLFLVSLTVHMGVPPFISFYFFIGSSFDLIVHR
jgi:hypothetical protein